MVLVAALFGALSLFFLLWWAYRSFWRPERNINDKIVLLTGAGGGLGRALALELAKRGCRLAIVDVVAAPNEETAGLVREVAGREDAAKAYTADLRHRDNILRLVDRVVADFGRIDILVSNAAILECGALEGFTDDTVDAIFEVNLLATVRLTRVLMPLMRRWGSGHIVAISSMAAHVGPPEMTLYSSTKAGLTQFMECLHHEVRHNEDPIYTTTVHPSFINTHAQLTSALELNRKIPILKTPTVARRIARAIANREVMVFIPSWMVVTCGMSGAWPRWLNDITFRLLMKDIKVPRMPHAFRHRKPSVSLMQDCLAGGHDLVDDPTSAVQTLMDEHVNLGNPLPFDFAPHVEKIISFFTERKRPVPEVVNRFIGHLRAQSYAVKNPPLPAA